MFNRDPYHVLVDYPHLTGFFHCSNPIFKPVLLKPPALLFLLLRDGCEQTLQIFTSMVRTSWGKGAWVVSTHIYQYSKGTPTYRPEPTHLEKYAHVKIESFPQGVKNTKEPCWNLRVWYTFFQKRSEIPPSLSGWWFFTNPSPKICSSNWIMKPQGSGWTFQKCLSCHHQVYTCPKTDLKPIWKICQVQFFLLKCIGPQGVAGLYLQFRSWGGLQLSL